ncbi:26808_t:CDS:1, partial [Racocetra persica]
MNQSTALIANSQLQNNNGSLQRPQNISSSQNANGQFRGASNIGGQPLRLQNQLISITIAAQYYIDLVEGTDPFTRTQGLENSSPQNSQSLTLG